MDKSCFIGRVMGVYFLIISAAITLNLKYFIFNVEQLIINSSLMFVTGFFTTILGILLIISHNVWRWSWPLIITLVGWIVFLKGMSMVFFPQLIDKITVLFLINSYVTYTFAGIDFLLGCILCYYSFKEH